MEVRSLSIDGFRNLATARLDFHPRLNLIVGRNGQGKTNLVESLAVVSGRSSFRAAEPAEIICDGASRATLACRLSGPAGEGLLGAALGAGTREHVWNGRKVSRLSASRLLPLVLLTEADLRRLSAPPAERRRALDRVAAAREPGHSAAVSRMERSRLQRNRLLSAPHPPDRDELLAFTDAFAEASAAVSASRRKVLPLLSTALARAAERLGSPYPALALTLRSDLGATADEPRLRDELLSLLARTLPEERRAGRTLHGPHRDDVVLLSGGRPLAPRASSGEARTLVLAWTLAEREVLSDAAGEAPALAFDDFDSEWDLGVLERFARALPDEGQLFLTSARAETVRNLPLPPGAVLEVEAGQVVSRGGTVPAEARP